MFPNLKTIFVVTGFLSISMTVLAESISEPISLHDAIRSTLNKNPSLQAYQFKYQALAGEKVTAALKPQWEISGAIENIAGTGEFSGVDASETTLSLSSVIELGNPREARSQLMTARQSALMSSERVIIANLLTEVTQQFILVLAAQERVKLQEKFYQIATENLQLIQGLIQAGRLSDAELLRAKASQAMVAIELNKSKTLLNSEKIRLGFYWGDTSPGFSHVNADLFQFLPSRPLNDWMMKLDKNPDIDLLNQDLAVKTAEIKQLRADGHTDLQWNAGIRQFQSTDDTAMVIGVSVPLGQKGRSSGAINTAIANQSLSEQERDAVHLKAAAELGSIYAEYQTALNQVELLRQEVLPQLEQAMFKTTKAFSQGRYSYLEFNLAQKQLLETKNLLVDAATEAHLLHARLERLTANSYLKED